MNKYMFENKVVIITGAATGIGRAAACRFAEEGAKICVADINLAGAEDTVRIIQKAGGQAFACQVDVAEEKDNARMVAETMVHYGRIDVGVLNAAIIGDASNFLESTTANFDRVCSVNQRGCYLGLRELGKTLNTEGSIVVISSVAGLLGWHVSAAYSATKHASIGLVRSAAETFAARGIRVNIICPGIVDTAMINSNYVEAPLISPAELKMAPFKGAALPQQIAEFVLFLASSRASYATGGVYTVDGGLTSMVPPPSYTAS